MPSSRTPWKKSRTYGDIYGGRQRRRNTDNIFNRLHSLSPPGPLDERPLVVQDNPSRNFVFPATGTRLLERPRALPGEDTEDITHLWLRKAPSRDQNNVPFGDCVAGSGVVAIVVYPWPVDQHLRLGRTRPTAKTLRAFAPWSTDLRKIDRTWCLRWDREAIERYTLDHVLTEMVGYRVAWHRNQWSGTSGRRADAQAASYAARWSAAGMTEHHLDEG